MKLFSPSCALAALASAAMLTACGQGLSADASAQTRTQALRVTDASPSDVAQMKAAVAPLVSRDPANVKVTRLNNGALERTFTSGFHTVVIAHKGADGKASVSCVDTVDGVDQAMTSAAPKAVR